MNIDYADSCWLNTETGDVLMIDEWTDKQARELGSPYDTDNPTIRLAWCVLWQDGEIGFEEREVEDQKTVDALMEPFTQVPQADTYEDYNLMVDFAATVQEPHLCKLLDVVLNGRGVFRRFRDVLARYPEERERWFEFRDDETRRQIDAWLQAVGVLTESREG
jgi:hypothetical protein